MKILLVDDTPIALKIGKILIEQVQNKCEVTCAENAEIAFEATKSTYFELIISDLCMPGMNGVEFAKTVKTTGNKSKESLIYICSSRNPSEIESEDLKLYCAGFLHKPLTHEHLKNIFNKMKMSQESN